MRYPFAVLLLVTGLSSMNLFAAPAPPISAVLDIGPPPKGLTLEQHRKRAIANMTRPNGSVAGGRFILEILKVPAVADMAPPGILSWLSENLRVKPEVKGNRLRLSFRAGKRTEQALILNAILHHYIQQQMEAQEKAEKKIQVIEEGMPRLKKLVGSETDPILLASHLNALASAPSRIAELRAEIARYKQNSIIKLAK